jgi:hypothetical protein
MKISELLNNLDEIWGSKDVTRKTIDDDASTSEKQEVMIPPLQQKIELMKKAVNVDSYYDDKDADEEGESLQQINLTVNVPKGQSSSKLELTINNPTKNQDISRMKKLAGLPATFIVSDDAPLDS